MKYLAAASIVVSSLAITPAFARYPGPPMGYPGYPMEPQYVLSSVYISGDAGMGTLATPDQNIPDEDGVTSATHSTGSFGGGGSIGFRRAVNPMLLLGLEAGYDYNGQAKYTQNYNDWYTVYANDTVTYKIISQDVHVLATGMVLFPSGFNFFAKGGAARVDQKLRITNQFPYEVFPYFITETSITAYKPMAAAGIGYRFRVLDIYAQYSHIFATNADNFSDLFNQDGTFSSVASVDTFKLGAAINVRI